MNFGYSIRRRNKSATIIACLPTAGQFDIFLQGQLLRFQTHFLQMLQFALFVASALAQPTQVECNSVLDLWVKSGGELQNFRSENCCDWTGVVCSKTQHAITEINWNNQNLQNLGAELHAEQFYRLQSLEKL